MIPALIIIFLLLTYSNKTEIPKDYNVLLISIDTLRADHLGVYGYFRNISPNIDELAKDSIVFKNAISQASWTLPSHISIITSKYPPEIYPYNLSLISDNWSYIIPLAEKAYLSHKNMASLLKDNGYSTAGFISNGWVASKFGLDEGFDTYDESLMDILNPSENITPKVLNWLETNTKNKFFLFIHYNDVHCPYYPLPQFRNFYLLYNGELNLSYLCKEDDFASYLNFTTREEASKSEEVKRIIGSYDDTIKQVDYFIGEILSKLKKLNIYEKTIIIILSDHGETLYDHTGSKFFANEYPGGYISHGYSLFDEVLRIPLIIKYPNSSHGTLSNRVRLIDLLPTVLDLLNIRYTNLSGENLLINRGNRDYLAVMGIRDRLPYGGYAFTKGEFKLITRVNENTFETYLYNLRDDPYELVDLADSRLEIVETLKSQLLGNLSFMAQNVVIKDHGKISAIKPEWWISP